MNFTMRPSTQDDFEFSYALRKANMYDHSIASHGQWDERKQRSLFKKKFHPAEQKIIVVNGKDIGTCATRETDTNSITIQRLHLLPDYQNNGIGSAILTDIISTAQKKGKQVRLSVHKSNTRAKQLYERKGFSVIAETPTKWRMST